MTPGEVTQTLENSLRGNVATNIQSGPKMVGLRAWIPHEDRFSTEDVRNLRLRSLDGHIFPLKRIANIEPVAGQSQIARDNLKRMIAVTEESAEETWDPPFMMSSGRWINPSCQKTFTIQLEVYTNSSRMHSEILLLFS